MKRLALFVAALLASQSLIAAKLQRVDPATAATLTCMVDAVPRQQHGEILFSTHNWHTATTVILTRSRKLYICIHDEERRQDVLSWGYEIVGK